MVTGVLNKAQSSATADSHRTAGNRILESLPPGRPGAAGWPWTEASPLIPLKGPDGKAWPRISLVIPSYNQGQYLEETIRSILLQGYPDLELLIMDGGSTDNSVDIIRQYERWLSGWISERDGGQSNAINNGFAQATGEIFNWLCSDDLLKPGALFAVAKAFGEDPACDVVAGNCYCDYETTPELSGVKSCRPEIFGRNPYAFTVWQPSCFFRRSAVGRSELVLKDLHYCMDRELWCHLWSRGAKWKWLPDVISVNRFTGANKSVVGKERIMDELDTIYRAYMKDRVPLTFWLRKMWLPLVRTHKEHRSALVRIGSRVLSRALSLSLHTVYSRDRVRVLQDEYYMYGMW